jgi:Protein of Unknown function (DUF2784)
MKARICLRRRSCAVQPFARTLRRPRYDKSTSRGSPSMATFAAAILLVHLAWIALVIFGALFTRERPVWSTLHILALLWGIAVEAGPWPCPLTLAEQYFEARAGVSPYHGGFLLHSLDAVVYPNLPGWVITLAGVSVCVFNLILYLWRHRALVLRRRASARS